MLSLGALSHPVLSGVLQGYVTNDKGDPIAFASITIEPLHIEVAANDKGYFNVSLKPQQYTITIQSLNYKTLLETVDVTEKNETTKTFVLQEEITILQEVVVSRNDEDPSYPIMRKAIARAPLHYYRIDSFSADCYLKLQWVLKKFGGLMKMVANKEFKIAQIQLNQPYVMESYNKIEYKSPTYFKEKVISEHSNLPPTLKQFNGMTEINAFVNFYKPEVYINDKAISPLSPQAFRYYTYELLGSFEDQKHKVFKIKFTPLSKSAECMTGVIKIRDEDYQIHSIDVTGEDRIGTYQFSQIYKPQLDGVWMPINYQIKQKFDAFGILAEIEDMGVISKYHLVINNQMNPLQIKKDTLAAKKHDKKKATLTQYQNVVRQFEKQMDSATKQERRHFIVEKDSTAARQTTQFWDSIRPLSLTLQEQQAYHRQDSLNIALAKEYEKNMKNLNDLRQKYRGRSPFKIKDVLFSRKYAFGKQNIDSTENPPRIQYANMIDYKGPLNVGNSILNEGFYTPIEGYFINTSLLFKKKIKSDPLQEWTFENKMKYSFSGNKLWHQYKTEYVKAKHFSASLSFGINNENINPDLRLSGFLISSALLFSDKNYYHVYQKKFVEASYTKKWHDVFSTTFQTSFSQRSPLVNQYHETWFKNKGNLQSNTPENLEQTPAEIDAQFHQHTLFKNKIELNVHSAQASNGAIFSKQKSIAALKASMTHGATSKNNFLVSDISWLHRFNIRRGNVVEYRLSSFVPLKKPSYFLDYHHILGNEMTAFSYSSGQFFSLPYYLLSSNGTMIESHVSYEMKKFLLTQWYPLRKKNITEKLYVKNVNALAAKNYYFETTYSVNGFPLPGSGIFLSQGFLNQSARNFSIGLFILLGVE